MSGAEVEAYVEGRAGRLRLNRPQALHALTLGMVEAMTAALLAWRDEPAVALVLLDHAEGRGFCAGGDIRLLAESGAKDGAEARRFFFAEYRLNHLLQVYPKPVVAVMDGVTMGGGVGLSMPAPFRVATEHTTFAMPETGIGLFPDVGGGWHLPRLPDHFGLWLALTGARLKAADCRLAGIATHYVESAQLDALKAELTGGQARPQAILAARAGDPGPAPLAAHAAAIGEAFSAAGVEEIVTRLKAMDTDWAAEQLKVLATKSPQTLKVAFRQLQLGAHAASFADNMVMEYRLGARVVRRPDFLEGVRAVIVDKDNQPRWNPTSLAEVSEALLDELFAPLPAGEEWTPLPQVAATQEA